jgi:hypothetical protein
VNAVAQAVHNAIFRFTDKQEEAQDVCTSDATHCMLFGGSAVVRPS